MTDQDRAMRAALNQAVTHRIQAAADWADKLMGPPGYADVYPTRYNYAWREKWIKEYHRAKRSLRPS